MGGPEKGRSKRFWYAVLAAGVLALGAGAGTFASFSAETDNPANTFATGTLLLSNQVQSGSVCFSSAAAGNLNHNCSVVINSTNNKPGQSATSLGNLATALTSGTTYTSISVPALAASVPAGTVLTLNLGSYYQQVIASSTANIGATTINVDSFKAALSFTTSTTVTQSAFVTATVTVGNVGTIDGSTLTLLPGATNLGDLTAGLTASTQYTSISVPALAAAVPAGATLILNPNNEVPTQQVTVATTANVGATSISVNQFTATGNYTTAMPVVESGCTSATVTNYTFNTGNVCNDAVFFIQEVSQGTVTAETTPGSGGVYTPNTYYNYCWFGSQPPVFGYPSPTAQTCDANVADINAGTPAGQSINTFTASDYAGIGLVPLSANGTQGSGTNLPAGSARQFLVGVYLPTSADNTDQSSSASFALDWVLNQ